MLRRGGCEGPAFHIYYVGFDMSTGPDSSLWANECLHHPGDVLFVKISSFGDFPTSFCVSFQFYHSAAKKMGCGPVWPLSLPPIFYNQVFWSVSEDLFVCVCVFLSVSQGDFSASASILKNIAHLLCRSGARAPVSSSARWTGTSEASPVSSTGTGWSLVARQTTPSGEEPWECWQSRQADCCHSVDSSPSPNAEKTRRLRGCFRWENLANVY